MFLPWHGIICPHRPVTAASGSSDPFARVVESYWSEEALRTLPFWPRMYSPDPDHHVSTGSRPVQRWTVQLSETCQSEWVGLRHVVFLSQAGHVLPVKFFKIRDSESKLCF